MLFSGKDTPELHGYHTVTFLTCVLHDGVDLIGKKHDIVVLNPDKVVPDELYECLQTVVDKAVLPEGL